MAVLAQAESPKLVVADTMDLWIESQRADVLALLKLVDGLIINDQEARLLAETDNLIRALQRVRELGPQFVVVKKGEHGAMYVGPDGMAVLPAYPTPNVVDPTGAGDTFAAGMLGWIAAADGVEMATMRRALAYACVTASFTVEGFSLDRLMQIERADIDRRLDEFRELVSF